MGEVRYDDPEIGILTVAKASNLLNAAARTESGALLPYVAIALFAKGTLPVSASLMVTKRGR